MRYPNGAVVDKAYDIVNVWDKAGRLTSTSSVNAHVLSFLYDPAGNRTRITYPYSPSLYATYDYDALNRVSAIRENGAASGVGVLATYAYDDFSRRTTVTLGNGNVVTAAYNDQDTLASLNHDMQGATTTNDVALGYTRNQVLQVTGRTISNPLYAWNGHYNVSRPYTVNGQNQYLTSGSKSLSYDGRGNLTGDGTWTFAYDVDNRLRSATRTGLSTTYLYDPAGRLRTQQVASTPTNFLYDGDRLVAEVNSGYYLFRRYVHGPGIDEPLAWYEGNTVLTDKRWFESDHQGSVIAVTNAI